VDDNAFHWTPSPSGRSTRALVAKVAGGMPYACILNLLRLAWAQFRIGSTKRSSSSSVSV
jgi:hypothetical protein